MANSNSNQNDAQLQTSKEFPNIQVDNVMLNAFDSTMKDLKASNDPNVKLFVDEIQKLKGYSVHDGSSYHGNKVNPDGSENKDCSGLHSGNTKEINIPMSFFKQNGGSGEFYGKQKSGDVKLYDATFAAAIVHEFAHATKMDREKSPLTNDINDRFDSLAGQIRLDQRAAQLKYGQHGVFERERDGKLDKRIDPGSKKEVLAVEIENYIMNHVPFNGVQSKIERLNFGDQGERFTSRNLQEWRTSPSRGYQMQGECENHTPLKLNRESDNGKTSLNNLNDEQKALAVAEQLASLKPEQQAKLAPEHKAILETQQAAVLQNEKTTDIELS